MSTTVHIDLGAFESNVARIVGEIAPAKLWVAIKSNAYGHGMLELADNAIKAGAVGLAVLDIPAALRLRSHGVTSTLFAWLHGENTDFAAAVENGIDLGVSTLRQLEAIAAAPGTGRVHLKIDTGLHRNGFVADDWDDVCRRAANLVAEGAINVVGIWSHLADAGEESDSAALAKFAEAVETARACGLSPEVLHIAASSAGLRNANARFDVARVGIACYGISPFDDVDGAGLGLRPVMTVTAPVIHAEMLGAVIAAGWFDGVPQVQSDAAWVSANGERALVVEVGPRHIVIDRPFPVGTVVDIIGGDGPTAEQWAGWANTIGDEIVTGVATSGRRVYVRN